MLKVDTDRQAFVRVIRQHAIIARMAFENGDYRAALRHVRFVLGSERRLSKCI